MGGLENMTQSSFARFRAWTEVRNALSLLPHSGMLWNSAMLVVPNKQKSAMLQGGLCGEGFM